MDTYTAGQTIYRAYVDSEHGASTVEFEVVSIHKDYIKISSEWDGRKLTRGTRNEYIKAPTTTKRCTRYEYTEAITAIENHFAPTLTKALEKLRERIQGELAEMIAKVEVEQSEIRAITRAIADLKIGGGD